MFIKFNKGIFFLFFVFLILNTGLKHTIAAADCSSNISGRSEAQLRDDLNLCNQEIAQWQSVLDSTKKDTASFERDAAILNAKIKQAQASIAARNIAISNLSKDIAQKNATIKDLDTRIEKGKQSLALLIRKTNELDSFSTAEVMLGNKDLSDFFTDLDIFSSIKKSLQDTFAELRGTKQINEQEKLALNKKQDQEADAKALIEQQKKQVERDEANKKALIALNKTKEKTYAQVLAEKQARAEQIRVALFGLRDTAAIPFGTALQYANEASAKTGIRPAFLLAILTQESNLGKNVGSCYVTDTATGNGKGANTGSFQMRVMHPTRDVPVFLDITSKLGMSYLSTRVSCWQPIYDSKGNPFGWGGAMGPAQFIPSTWVLFENRIAKATGSTLPNPWNPKDAFMASALYLTDLGAVNGSYTGEIKAACKYYGIGGSACSYGKQVMAKAQGIQNDMIDPLQNI